MARPVVASPGAFEGIEAQPGRDLVVADSWEEQAEAILSLLGDPSRARSIGDSAHHCVQSRYRWEIRLAPLTAILSSPEKKAAA